MQEILGNDESNYQLIDSRDGKMHKILLTTFNKELTKSLSDWLMELLSEEDSTKKENSKDNWTKREDRGGYEITSMKTGRFVRILHFDIVGTRLFQAWGSLVNKDTALHYASMAIQGTETNMDSKEIRPAYLD